MADSRGSHFPWYHSIHIDCKPRPLLQRGHENRLRFYSYSAAETQLYYELFQPNETIRENRYRLQLMRLNRALKQRHEQCNSPTWQCSISYSHADNTWKRWNGKFYSIRRTLLILFRLITTYSIDNTQPIRAVLFIWRYQKMSGFVNSLKKTDFFRRGIRILPERWKKAVACDGQYFE